MDADRFNMSMRKFLKQVGVTAQQAIEDHVRTSQSATGRIKIRAVITAPEIGLQHVVDGEIDLS
jgi:hypothetical protein